MTTLATAVVGTLTATLTMVVKRRDGRVETVTVPASILKSHG
jgi:hypothetical protein